MKNTFLKKASAIALAAVMAVTFAPVASLDAFADELTENSNNVDLTSGSGIEIKDPKVNKIGVATGGTLKISTAGSFEVDVKGKDVTIDFAVAGATVTVKNSVAVKAHGSEIPTVTAGSTASPVTSGTIVLAGNFKVNRNNGSAASGAAVKCVYASGQPGAIINSTEYSGQSAINAGYLETPAANSNVTAVSGNVKVDKLLTGCYAIVATDAAVGTTVEATADTDVTLQKWTTTFTFPYVSYKNYNHGTGWEGTGKTGRGTYTMVQYFAGPRSLTRETEKATTDLGRKLGIFTGGGIARKDYAKALNADDVYIDANEVKGTTAIDYTFANDIKKGTKDVDDTYDGYYYTFDPSSYVDEGDSFAILDGTQYRKTDSDASLANGMYPQKSFKLVQSKDYTKEDKNKNVVFNIKFDELTNHEITLEAPSDISVIKQDATSVYGKNTTYALKAGFFGTEKFGDDNVKYFADTYVKDGVKAVDYTIQHVADGATKTFTLLAVDPNASVAHENGIGYYRVTDVGGKYGYTFGATKIVTKEFEDAAQGVVTNGVTAHPDFADGTIFASKEIKTTVKGVNRDVTFLGEISAEATATAADGSKTWEINLADTATNDKAVVAYRLYDGNRGEHIYTYNAKERDMLVAAGWKEETSDIKVLPVDAKTGVTVYRVYNPNNGGAHVFTTNPAEVKMLLDAGWEEGVAVFKTPAAGTANTLPVYRVYNTGSKNGEHQFTTSAAEKDNLVNHGWKLEGTPWYSFK